jgi:hypothetical protein
MREIFTVCGSNWGVIDYFPQTVTVVSLTFTLLLITLHMIDNKINKQYNSYRNTKVFDDME